MKLWRIIKSVRQQIFLNKLRAILSITGIAIGIACSVTATGIGEGGRELMMSQISQMGSNLITISAGTYKQAFGRKMQTTFVTTLKEKDAIAIEEGCGCISSVAPAQGQWAFVKYTNSTTSTIIIGTTPNFSLIRNYPVSSGRFFNAEENRLSLRTAVIGQKILKSLFLNTDPINKIIRINGIPFEITGTLKSKGLSYDGADEDNVIFIPLNTALHRVFNIDYIGYIYVQAMGKDKLDTVERGIRNLLRERHRLNNAGKKDDFTIQNIYTTIKASDETNATFTDLITAISALSLLVGGVGILAVMLLSVKERSAEIGLRMAVGAKPSDILFQFLLEAASLSVLGGCTGIITGIAALYLMKSIAGVSGIVSFNSTAFSLIISLIIGILFGVMPARRASLVMPDKVLRK
jgi:putative ABC transport system permease protein